MKTGWLILTAILFIIGALMLLNIIYWMVIGYYPYGSSFLFTTFATMLGFFVSSYLAWERARNPNQITKSKSQ
jgi:ABC-type transport system involved in Fe-S cluster assembly fused permease/ATPase subunit